MLVLSRLYGEKIYIGDNIVITVVEIRDNKVRLGIEAPRDVPVNREEMLPARARTATSLPPGADTRKRGA